MRQPREAASAENFEDRFRALYPMVEPEIEGLTESRLDFTSVRWRWAEWSIRRQIGHMTSVFFSWLVDRWEGQAVTHPAAWYREMAAATADREERRLMFEKGDAGALLGRLRDGIGLALEIVAQETPESMRDSRSVSIHVGGGWRVMERAHPTGVTQDLESPGLYHLNLEGTLRQVYYEQTTHLYNVQRLKRAQGLPVVSEVPFEGFWALDGWDRSEP